MNKWEKIGKFVGIVVITGINAYVFIDLIRNIRADKSIVSDLCAIFAIAAWQNTIKLSIKCQKSRTLT
jgi:hypothetical protein